ncbi:4'-phosphopantetheinyl transferase superfamily protein [Dokdonella sp.]|uniref:4'-phosphopantetheinyl transferase family protein n=1 Tax=Dokdonella sp. TaxID=2291710 RepID=UPI0035271213
MQASLPGQAAEEPADSVRLEFETAPANLDLLDDEVHVWLWQAARPIPPRDVSRQANEQLLGLLHRYAGAAPPALQRGEHGKPYASQAGFPQFNLSHGGQCVLFAFSKRQELGIDVDTLARRHTPLELARRFFADEESRALERLDGSSQGPAFMRLWTGKEAVLKALGQGLSFGLHRLQFELDHEGRAGRLKAIDTAAGAVEDWQLHRFEPLPGHVAALAWRGPALRIRAFLMEDAQVKPAPAR